MAIHSTRPSRVVALLATLALLGSLGVVTATPAGAATINVPGDFPTIQQAIDAASAGDTITVAPGRYVGRITFRGKDVTIASTAGPTATVIDADGGVAVAIGPGGSLIGFGIVGTFDSRSAVVVSGAGTLIQGNVFDGNVMRGGATGAAIGDIAASAPTIDGNYFTRQVCQGQGNPGVVAFGRASSPVITNNVFADNQCHGVSLSMGSTDTPEVVNNLFTGNIAGVWIDRRVDLAAWTYRNNVIVGNTVGVEVLGGSEAFNPVWEHNLVFGNGTDYSGMNDLTGAAGNLSVDPGLYYDLRLCPGTPAVDAGTAAGAPATDFDGVARPQNGVVDIGAFELVPQTGPSAPVAVDDGPVLLRRGETVTVAAPGVLGSDADAQCDALTAVKASDPSHGSLTLAADGSFTYAHDGSTTATDSFTYQASDGSATSAPATVSIIIAPNEPPVAGDDFPIYVSRGESTSYHVLQNDFDPEGEPLTAVKVSDPAHGTLVLNPDGLFTYTHDGSWTATDSFTYSASDGALLSEPARVTFEIALGGDGAVGGTITSGGQPVEGMCVWLGTRSTEAGYTRVGDAETAADGTYLVEIAPGTYELFLWDCSTGTFEYEYYDNAATYLGARPVSVDPGVLVAIDAEVQLGWAITGTVTADYTRDPLQGITVLASVNGIVVGGGETGADGNYAVTGLRRGVAYTMLFYDDTGAYLSEFYDDELDSSAADLVRASSEVVTGIDAGLQPMPEWYDLGLVDPATGRWHLSDILGERPPVEFYYGNPGDYPIVGDWDCDGDETPGLYRQSDGYVYLRNSNTVGVADIKFFFGDPGDIPLAGDFNGDGCDTVSIFRPAEGRVFIINDLGSGDAGLGAAEHSYYFGNPGDKPFPGDFDGDGVETIGLHRESTGLVYFSNKHRSKVADNEFIFGDPGDRLVCGDWNLDGLDSPGVFRPGNTLFYLRFTNTAGVADAEFEWGEPDWLPVAGVFWPDSAATRSAAMPGSRVGQPLETLRQR